jgi:hypothetical protein
MTEMQLIAYMCIGCGILGICIGIAHNWIERIYHD